MRKRTLIIGIVLLVVGLSVHTGAGGQSNEAVEFIKLLNEAENYFLDEDYDRVKMVLEKAEKILKQKMKLAQKAEFFFDLSTPENAVRSFLEASFLGDEETVRKCWSKRTPDYLVSMTVSAMQKEIKEDAKEKPELTHPDMLKLIVNTFHYEKEWTGANSYYVWATPPGKERSEKMQFRVVKENDSWKVLAFKVWEEKDWFKALIGEKYKKGLLSQWASKARASSQYGTSRWSAQQATGEPNTCECGDIDTAWAPKSSGSEPEWLELTFDTPVYVTKLRVYETYNAGFIYKVEFVDVYGRKHTVWQGKDTTPCPGWFEINLDQTWYLVQSVILHAQIKDWEEIDAVELTGIPISK